MHKILIVDDDYTVFKDIRQYFEPLGYTVVYAETAQRAKEIIHSAALDCIILDVKLPDESGFDLCVHIRELTGLPVLFLSGYTEEQSRIMGLTLGGDDYVCKPFSLAELELRVRARIRTGRVAMPAEALCYGKLTISPGTRSVGYGNVSVELSAYEFDLLYFLARHPGVVFTYAQIFDQIWKSPVNKGVKSLQMMIVRIRQKLLELCPEHEYIQTVRRKGYYFAP